MKKNVMQPRPHFSYVSTKLLDGLICFLQQSDAAAAQELCQKMTTMAVQPTMSIAVWWDLLEQIYVVYPSPDLGLQIGRCIQPHHVGLLGYLVLNCTTLEQALLRLNRFEALLQNFSPSMIEYEGDSMTIYWSGFRSTKISDQVGLAAMLSILRVLLDDATFTPQRVQTIHPKPKNPMLYDDFVGCPIEFDASCESHTFTAAQLARPIKTADPYLIVILEQQANAMLQANALLQSHAQQDEWLLTVQKNIAAALKDGKHSAAMLAQRMGLSERSFFRYLRYRHVNYSTLLQNVRYELAKDYLTNSTLSLSEIAFLLGYSEQSVFSKVFLAWSNSTPLKYRKASLN